MKIAYLCLDPGIPVFGSKGASVHIQEVVRELLALGHQVKIFAIRSGDQVPADLAEIKCSFYPLSSKDPLEREKGQQLVSEEICADLQAWGADFIYERYSLLSTALADSQLPGVLEVNAPLIDEQKKHRVLVLEDQAQAALQAQAQAARLVVAVSDQVGSWVQQAVPQAKVITVANGVSINRIRPSAEAAGLPIVTFVGTLKPWHGVADLISAAALAQEKWQLRILGDGPEFQALKEQAQQLGLTVDFQGAISPEEMPQRLAGSALGVAPYPAASQEEEHYFSPLKVYEYLAAGLPVVATSIGQIPDIIQGAGLLVPGSDPQALAQAIDQLVANPDLRARYGARARQLAEEKHSWSQVVATILQAAGV